MTSSSIWKTTRFDLDLAERPLVMGIVNVTPDSFSDGGQHADASSAIDFCERLLGEGVDILDLGGESTRPGAPRLEADEEWKRLEPVLRAALNFGVPVSVDTCKTEVMRRALDLGVDIINDVQALRDEGADALLASHGSAGICLMHMRGQPAGMQRLTDYEDVVTEVASFLADRLRHMVGVGVAAERITLDPGYGFAKTVEQNLVLQRRHQTQVDHDVIDHVMAQHHLLAQLVRLIAEYKIIGAILRRHAKPAHSANRLAAKGHRGSERELHAFHHARHQHARCHFH